MERRNSSCYPSWWFIHLWVHFFHISVYIYKVGMRRPSATPVRRFILTPGAQDTGWQLDHRGLKFPGLSSPPPWLSSLPEVKIPWPGRLDLHSVLSSWILKKVIIYFIMTITCYVILANFVENRSTACFVCQVICNKWWGWWYRDLGILTPTQTCAYRFLNPAFESYKCLVIKLSNWFLAYLPNFNLLIYQLHRGLGILTPPRLVLLMY